VVDTIDEAVKAVAHVARLSRHACRRAFEQRFDATSMARNYVEVYSRLIHKAGCHHGTLVHANSGAHPDSRDMETTVWPTLSHIS
jgi:hypothetical protein